MNLSVIIILGIIIVILLIFLYTFFNSSISPLIKYVNLNNTSITSIPYTSITNPKSTRFAYSVWIYVNSWASPNKNSAIKSNIFYRPNEVGLEFDNTRPILYCNFNTLDTGLPDPTNSNNTIIITNNFPLQTWTNVILNVDNNYLDIYINGQLMSSIVLQKQYANRIIQANDNIFIGEFNGFGSDIYLANLERWGVAINPQTAYYYYLNGLRNLPNDSTAYKFKLSLLKDNNLLQSVNL